MEAGGGGGVREERQKVMRGVGGLKGSALIRDREGVNGETDMETRCPHTCCFIDGQH